MVEREASAITIQNMRKSRSTLKAVTEVAFTLTALVAPFGPSFPPKFTSNDFPKIRKTLTLSLCASMLLEKVRCSCLGQEENGGFNRRCLTESHWIVEHGPNSQFRFSEDGKLRIGVMQKYDGYRKGGKKKVFVGADGGEDEWIWCVEDTKETL